MPVLTRCYLEEKDGKNWTFLGEMILNPEPDEEGEETILVPEWCYEVSSREHAAILLDLPSCRSIRAAEPYTPVAACRGYPFEASPEMRLKRS
jgi:hypothetical protein